MGNRDIGYKDALLDIRTKEADNAQVGNTMVDEWRATVAKECDRNKTKEDKIWSRQNSWAEIMIQTIKRLWQFMREGPHGL
jgi:hypothetical protein